MITPTREVSVSVALRWFLAHILSVCVVLMVLQAPVYGQVASGPTVLERLNSAIKPLDARIAEIEKALASRELSEEQLTPLRAELESISKSVLERMTSLQPAILDIDTQIERLPPVPAEGEPPEAEAIAEQRQELAQRRANITIALKDAERLSVRAIGLISQVLEQRRAQFVQSILRQRTLDASVINEVVAEGPPAASRVFTTLSTWVTTVLRFNLMGVLGAILLTGFVVGLLFWVLRPIRLWVAGVRSQEHITDLQRIILAFFSTVLPGLAVGITAIALYRFMGYFGLYRLRIDQMVYHLLLVATGVSFVAFLLRATLSPTNVNRRLISMQDGAAKRLFWLGLIMAIIYGVDYYGSRIIDIFALPVSFTIIKTLVASLLIATVLVCVVMTRLKPREADEARSGFRGWRPTIYWAVWLSIIVIVGAAISGYLSLSRFIAGQIVITGTILATAYLGVLTSRAIAAPGAFASTRIGQRLNEKRSLGDFRLDQLGLILSLVINFLVFIIGVPVLLLQWGIQDDEIMAWGRSAFTGFSIGGVEVSIARIMLALGAFALLIALTRVVQRWFENKVLARTQLDSGVKNSIKSGVGYVGFFLAALVGISWAGFNLSNIALIAGALSVGIGFGLQNIVNNFVSGIIMLIERPIKVGDIISVAGSEGFVRKINVRATELETFDRQSVIIPNSEVINTSVGNWMHKDHVRRIVIPVGVAYGSDVEKVRELLYECVKGDERIATHPAPFVHFSDFGASSLDFQLRFFIRDLMEYPVVETDMRFAIDRIFRENDIEIPFPQTDLHIRSGLHKA
ncbi:MAG: mechanosensitive ion channel domain-containing protein [Pseudomonadota bacterium]